MLAPQNKLALSPDRRSLEKKSDPLRVQMRRSGAHKNGVSSSGTSRSHVVVVVVVVPVVVVVVVAVVAVLVWCWCGGGGGGGAKFQCTIQAVGITPTSAQSISPIKHNPVSWMRTSSRPVLSQCSIMVFCTCAQVHWARVI